MTTKAALRILSYPLSKHGAGNPYMGMLNTGLRALHTDVRRCSLIRPWQRGDVIHVQWFESLYMERFIRRSPLLFELACRSFLWKVRRTKRRGGRLVWTAHNLKPHDPVLPTHRSAWERWLPRFMREVDDVICLSDASRAPVRARYPELTAATFWTIPHPHYCNVLPKPVPREYARQRLGLPRDAFIVGCIGLIRRYKNLVEAIVAFGALADDSAYLLIAGVCRDAALQSELERAAKHCPRVLLRAGELSDAELVEHYAAIDVAPLNQTGMLNSGAALTALTLNRPIVAPAVGSMCELRDAVGAGWCQLFEGNLDHPKLQEAILKLRCEARENAPDLRAFDPQRIAALHLHAYTHLPASAAADVPEPAHGGSTMPLTPPAETTHAE
ncbi:MAG: hypothetical protein RL385_2054 [Pseudomonadota bacterium]